MNITEFEASLGKVPLNPKSVSAFQTLTHQLDYTPEDFIVYMNQGGNGAYSVNKQKAGAGTFKYSVFSLTGGYINTTVSDQIQTGGNSMEFVVPEWVKDVTMYAVSGFIMGFGSTFVMDPAQNWADFQTALYGASVFGFYAAVKAVLEYVKKNAPISTKAKEPVSSDAARKPLLNRML